MSPRLAEHATSTSAANMPRLLLATAALCLLTGGVVGRPGVGVGVGSTSRQGGARPDFAPTFDGGGVANLDASLTINGITVEPLIRYYGGDAASGTWPAATYGTTLTEFLDTNTNSFNEGSPLMGADDDSILLSANAGSRFETSVSATGDLGTGDLALAILFKANTGGGTFLGKLSTDGYQVAIASSTLRFLLDDADAQAGVATGTLINGAWYYANCFINRDEASTNGSRCYANNTAGTGVDLSALASTLTNSIGIAINSNGEGSAVGEVNTNLAYIAVYEAPGAWFQAGAAGPAEWATVHAEQFAKLTGTWDSTSSAGPTVATRSSTGTLRKRTAGVTKLYTVGGNWPRTERWVDDSGGEVVGYLAEPGLFNLITDSMAMDNWTEKDAGDTQDIDGADDAFGNATMDGNIADATDGEHGFTHASDATTATACTVSATAIPGDQGWVYLSNDTVANAYAYFNIGATTCAVGTVGAAATAAVEDYGTICSVEIRLTCTAAAQTIALQTAEADNDKVFAGDASTVNTYFGTVQVEQYAHKTSFVATTTTAGQRGADVLRYDGTGIVGAEGSAVVSLWAPTRGGADTYFLSLSDGLSAADRISFAAVSATGAVSIRSRATAGANGTTGSSTDIMTGAAFTAAGSWATNAYTVAIDGADETIPDASADVPDDIDTIGIGQHRDSGSQFGGIITSVKIYDQTGVTE